MNEKDCRELEFNTYCTFTQEKQSLEETMERIFRDYIEKEGINAR